MPMQFQNRHHFLQLDHRHPHDGSPGRIWSAIDRTAPLPRHRQIKNWGKLLRRKWGVSIRR
ncbi:hypothetical protein BSIN_5456 [Burkholderia singularis]|uniref:Uncharacterized protein n=1 Tax=Burkholderia singularis TaxID=1503053 RepID=A0A238GZV0_9BURK|nr:hypothetical protein BSIN_5456 [Burkholderia singularis]